MTFKLDVYVNYKPELNSIYCKTVKVGGANALLHPLWLRYWPKPLFLYILWLMESSEIEKNLSKNVCS
jgi:hypothetical protein